MAYRSPNRKMLSSINWIYLNLKRSQVTYSVAILSSMQLGMTSKSLGNKICKHKHPLGFYWTLSIFNRHFPMPKGKDWLIKSFVHFTAKYGKKNFIKIKLKVQTTLSCGGTQCISSIQYVIADSCLRCCRKRCGLICWNEMWTTHLRHRRANCLNLRLIFSLKETNKVSKEPT